MGETPRTEEANGSQPISHRKGNQTPHRPIVGDQEQVTRRGTLSPIPFFTDTKEEIDTLRMSETKYLK